MLDKIFNSLNRLAKKVSEKNVSPMSNNYRNKFFMGVIIVMTLYQGIVTYQLGECINCYGELTGEEAVEMLNKGTPENNALNDWYKDRTYIPFTSIGKFFKQWLINVIGPIVVFSLIFFSLYFITKLIDNKMKQLKTKKMSELLGSFMNNNTNKR
jgi:fumarate reductase subunit D